MEQRTGKTIVALALLTKRFHKGLAKHILVVCPKDVKFAWKENCAEFLDIPYRTNSDPEQQFADKDRLMIFLMNYESTRNNFKWIRKQKFDHIIYDESHKLKQRNSQQSRAASRLSATPYRVIMTATPFPETLMDLWPQFRFLRPEIFGTRWKVFDKEYLQKTGYMGYKRKVKRRKKNKILKLVGKNSYRVELKDALPYLPKTVSQFAYFTLPPKLQKMHDELEDDLITMIENDKYLTTIDIPVTKLIRLQQITGGFLHSDNDEVHHLHSIKSHYIREFAYEHKKKIVVFARYKEEIKLIYDNLREWDITVGVLAGSTTLRHCSIDTRGREKTLWRFTHKKDPQVLVAQIAAGGLGLDFSVADTAIFYSSNFSGADFDHATKRLTGPKQQRGINLIFLAFEKSIDIDIWDVLKRKYSTAKTILQKLRKESKMAKAKKVTKKSKPKKAETEKPKYGASYIAEKLGVGEFQARSRLRAAGIKKQGRSYGWDTKAEADEVIEELEEASEKPKKSAKKKVKKKKKAA